MAFYKIEWKNSAYKELQKLPRPIITRVVAAVLGLSDEPFPHGVKKLVGSEFSYQTLSEITCEHRPEGFLRVIWASNRNLRDVLANYR